MLPTGSDREFVLLRVALFAGWLRLGAHFAELLHYLLCILVNRIGVSLDLPNIAGNPLTTQHRSKKDVNGFLDFPSHFARISKP